MDNIFKEMEDRANKMACGCLSCSKLCDQCQVSQDQARLIAAMKLALEVLEAREDRGDLWHIHEILEGVCDS